ncbi:MAG: chorismate synthase [Bacteroidales bacterium]|nr:chorismate synthase [Bacteroidales bacterium]
MNSFGRKFRVSIFGESHGEEVGIVMDGVPAGIMLSADDLRPDIARRKSGAKGTTPRIEPDKPVFMSGVFEGHTTGAPLTIIFKNTNTHSSDYSLFKDMPRPGHADYTADVKWDGYNDPRGGGHFSARVTTPVVAAGTIAKMTLAKVISERYMIDVRPSVEATLIEIGGEKDQTKWPEMIDSIVKEGDSMGGVVECVIKDIPAGTGEPFFDSVESVISHAIFSIPGVRGIEFGDGFAAAKMKGSEHNDPFIADEVGEGEYFIHPSKNGAGGINGGITNGNPIVFRVAFKPTSTIHKAQTTYNFAKNEMDSLAAPGRHDACFALRTPVIVESMAALALADLVVLQ